MLSPLNPGFLPYISGMHGTWWSLLACVCACDASKSAATLDASIDDAVIDAPSDPSTWARYSIAPGAHSATVTDGASGNPLAGFVNGIAVRTFDLALDPSAIYVLTDPTQPEDQFDWNKLPGVSDCGTLDLSRDGTMFGWRWRLDTTPEVLEITAYANNVGTHLTPDEPLLVLDADDLASVSPLHYRLELDGELYRFSIAGEIRGRAIDVATTLPRRCATTDPGTLVQWAAGLYFGGTSTAPSTITALIFE